MVSKLKIRNPIRRLNFFLKTIIIMIIICPSHWTSGCPLEHYNLEWNMGFPFRLLSLMFSCSYVLMFSCSHVLIFSCSHVFMFSCFHFIFRFPDFNFRSYFQRRIRKPKLIFSILDDLNSPPISTLSPFLLHEKYKFCQIKDNSLCANSTTDFFYS